MLNHDLPDTGDILFTRGKTLFSKVTCRISGPCGHQATFFDSGFIVEASIDSGRVEKVECNQKFYDMAVNGTEWIIFHWVKPTITPWLRSQVQCDLLEAVEFERYSVIELPLQMIDFAWNNWICRRPVQGYDAYVFRRLGDIWDNGVICSKTSNRALIRNGFMPRTSGLEYGSPSDTYRYLKGMVNKEVIILDYSKGWFDYNGA